MQRISVDLPVPDAPMIVVMPCGRDPDADVRQHGLAGDVRFGEVPELEHRSIENGALRGNGASFGVAARYFFFAAAAASAASRAVSLS